jgi:hypothetical protein
MISLLLLLAFMVQGPKVVTCTVKEPDKSVACPEDGKMVLFTFTDPAEAKVKAIITDRWFKAVVSCEVRVWRNIKFWRMFKAGEIVPNMLYTLPDDCQPWHGKQE